MVAPGRYRWLWISLAILALDRASKSAIERFTPEGYVRPLIDGFLDFVHTHNPGIAFGLLADSHSKWQTALLAAGAAGVIVLLVWLLVTGRAGSTRSQVALSLILGGAAGNLADRLLHGGVIDFVDVHWRNYHWPAFNVADSAITIGALLLAVDLIFPRRSSSN